MTEAIVGALVETGWIVLPDFFPPAKVQELRGLALAQWEAGEFHAAGTGRGAELSVKPGIRSDQVVWVGQAESGALAEYQAFLDDLQGALNRELYLGLSEFEGHFALYPPGSFYAKHLDNFRGTSARQVTAILYLNGEWQPDDGGLLRLYTDGTDGGAYLDIPPLGGQLVVFHSPRFWHEVLPANRERISLTGWFRTR